MVLELMESFKTLCFDMVRIVDSFSDYMSIMTTSENMIKTVKQIITDDQSFQFDFDHVECFQNKLILTSSADSSFVVVYDLICDEIVSTCCCSDFEIRGNCAIDRDKNDIYVLANLTLNNTGDTSRNIDLMDVHNHTGGYTPHSAAIFNNHIIVFYTTCVIRILDMRGKQIRYFNFGCVSPSCPRMYVNNKGLIFVSNVSTTRNIRIIGKYCTFHTSRESCQVYGVHNHG